MRDPSVFIYAFRESMTSCFLFWHRSKFKIIWSLIYDVIGVIGIFGAITRLKSLLKLYYLSIPSAGEHLRICPQGYTCCTIAMEETLSNLSRREFEGLVREAGRSIQASLNAQYRTFDSESKTQMHLVLQLVVF